MNFLVYVSISVCFLTLLFSKLSLVGGQACFSNLMVEGSDSQSDDSQSDDSQSDDSQSDDSQSDE